MPEFQLGNVEPESQAQAAGFESAHLTLGRAASRKVTWAAGHRLGAGVEAARLTVSGHHPPEVSLLLCGRSGSGVPPRLAQPSAHLRASAFLPWTLSHRLCPCLAEGQVLRVRGILQQPREGPAVACGTQQDPYCACLPFGKFPCHPPFCSASGLRIFGHKRASR